MSGFHLGIVTGISHFGVIVYIITFPFDVLYIKYLKENTF